jgi:hypothetical protein
MSGQFLGSAVGAGLAYFSGGSAGMGWALGGVVGGILAPGKPTSNGPRQADLRPQSSDYGRPIPIVYGHTALGGNVIWAMNLIEKDESAGGKGGGGGATQKAYYANFAVAVCEGEHQIARIWAGPSRRLIFDGINYPTTWGLRLYRGTADQLPDPLIESDKGAAHTPAYRGTVYAVFDNYPLKDDGNMIPELWIELGAVLDKGDCPPPCSGYPANETFSTPYTAPGGYGLWTVHEPLNDRFWTFSSDGSGAILLTDGPTLSTTNTSLVLGDGHFAQARYSALDQKMWMVNGQYAGRVDCKTLATDFITNIGAGWVLAPDANTMAVDQTSGDMWVVATHSGDTYVLQLSAANGSVLGTTLIGTTGSWEATIGNLIVDESHKCWFSRGITIPAATIPVYGFVPAHRGTDHLWYIAAGSTTAVDGNDNYFCADEVEHYVRILRMSHDTKRDGIWLWVQEVHFDLTTHVETIVAASVVLYALGPLKIRLIHTVAKATPDYLFGYDAQNDLCWFRSDATLIAYCGNTGAPIHKTAVTGAMGDRSVPIVRSADLAPDALYYDKPGAPYALGKYGWDEVSKNPGLAETVTITGMAATQDGGYTVTSDYTWSNEAVFVRGRNTVLHFVYQGFYRDFWVKEYDAATGAPTGVEWALPGADFGTIHIVSGATHMYNDFHDRIWTYTYTYGTIGYTGHWDAYKYDGTLVATFDHEAGGLDIVPFWETADPNTGDQWFSYYSTDSFGNPLSCFMERRSGLDFSLLEKFDLTGNSAGKYLSLSRDGDCYFLQDGGPSTGHIGGPPGSLDSYAYGRVSVCRRCSGGVVDTVPLPFPIQAMTYDSIHHSLWVWDSSVYHSSIKRWDLDTGSVGAVCAGDTGSSHYGFVFHFDEVNNVFWLYIEDYMSGGMSNGGLINLTPIPATFDPNYKVLAGWCGNDGHLVHAKFSTFGGARYPGTSNGLYGAHMVNYSWYADKPSGASIFLNAFVDLNAGSVITQPDQTLTEYHWDVAERAIVKDVPVTLGQIVADISYRVNLKPTQIDVSQLPDIVDGYAIAKQTAARDAIEVLRPIWQFDGVESQAKIKWVKRGVTPSYIIPDDDLSAHTDNDSRPEERITLRQMEHDLPFRLNVQYMLAALKYQPAMKHQQRYRSKGAMDSTLDTTLTLTDAKAQEAADTNLYLAWTERTHMSFTLPAKKYVALEPTDVVRIAGYTVRLVKMTYNLAGVVSCDALVEDPTYYGESHVVVTETQSTFDPVIDPARSPLIVTTTTP